MTDWAAEAVTRGDIWLMFIYWQMSEFSNRREKFELPWQVKVDTGLSTILAQIRDKLYERKP